MRHPVPIRAENDDEAYGRADDEENQGRWL